MDIMALAGIRKADSVADQSDLNAMRGSVTEQDLKIEMAGISSSFGKISFTPEGVIIDANKNFLDAMGYTQDEVVGKHHRIFVDPIDASSAEYREFWESLRAGQSQDHQFRRIAKDGREVYIQASYMPLKNSSGEVVRVMKLATDITAEIHQRSIQKAKLDAISRSQAVVEFDADGIVLNANNNFLTATGYSLIEIQGRHHRMFVSREYAETRDYAEFWARLKRGEYVSGIFQRVTKAGDDLFLEASYNPMYDAEGRQNGVVKFATDITKMMEIRNRSADVGSSVAASVDQMGNTIHEISANLNLTASLANSAESQSQETRGSTQQLLDSSRAIEGIVGAIRELADQTKLLALNASIESARAGDAGRGFAVVANEVKDLARQTSEETSRIAESVNAIRSSIAKVVASSDAIADSVTDVSANMTNIAAAVEEQSVTMNDLKRTSSELVTYLK